MSLRVKSMLVASGTMAILMLILFVSARLILTDSYTRLEQQDTLVHVERALNAFTNELLTLETTATDYATWDDTYNFIPERTPGYVESNYTDSAFANSRLSLVMLIDAQGQAAYVKGYNLGQNQAQAISPETQALILNDEVLLQPTRTLDPRQGLLVLPDGLYLIVSQPILTSAGDGPSRGALIMARAVTPAEIARLSEVTKLQLTMLDLSAPLEDEAQAARALLSTQQPMTVRVVNEQLVQGYGLIEDIHGQPVQMLRVDLDRRIYQQGQQTLSYLMLALVGAGLFMGTALTLLLERTVIARLHRLNREVRAYLEELEPTRVTTQTFAGALEELIGTFTAGQEVQIEQRIDADAVALIPPLQIAEIMNILREALSNSLRHGQARRLTLLVGRGDQQVALAVQDDGRGFVPQAGSPGGHGLVNMEARAAALGGSLRIESAVGKGTRVLLTLPVASPA